MKLYGIHGVELVDVYAALMIRKIMRIGPKKTRKKRRQQFMKDFNKK